MRKMLLGLVLMVLGVSCSSTPEMDNRVVLKAGDVEFTLYDMAVHLVRFNYEDADDELFKKQDNVYAPFNVITFKLIQEAAHLQGLLSTQSIPRHGCPPVALKARSRLLLLSSSICLRSCPSRFVC